MPRRLVTVGVLGNVNAQTVVWTVPTGHKYELVVLTLNDAVLLAGRYIPGMLTTGGANFALDDLVIAAGTFANTKPYGVGIPFVEGDKLRVAHIGAAGSVPVYLATYVDVDFS